LIYECCGEAAFLKRRWVMRELILILGAACIASLPFVAFSGLLQTPARQSNVAMWGEDLRQTGTSYSMPTVPKAMTVSMTSERK
jgi:hypothetical protein